MGQGPLHVQINTLSLHIEFESTATGLLSICPRQHGSLDEIKILQVLDIPVDLDFPVRGSRASRKVAFGILMLSGLFKLNLFRVHLHINHASKIDRIFTSISLQPSTRSDYLSRAQSPRPEFFIPSSLPISTLHLTFKYQLPIKRSHALSFVLS